MKPSRWFGAAALYLIFLAATAPAGLLLGLVNRLGPAQVTAQGVSGTLWHGRAEGVVLRLSGGHPLFLGRGEWGFRPLRLLLGEAAADIRISGPDAAAEGLLAREWGGFALRRFRGEAGAGWLAGFWPDIQLWRPEGMVRVTGERFFLGRGRFQGGGEILWERAGLSLSVVKPLGSYGFQVSGEGDRMVVRLATRSGPLELSGDGSWSTREGLEFHGRARARFREAELRDLLGLMGKPQPDGSRALALSLRPR